jgi:hypothetical protein
VLWYYQGYVLCLYPRLLAFLSRRRQRVIASVEKAKDMDTNWRTVNPWFSRRIEKGHRLKKTERL